jgi:hypothetical protein
MKVLQKYIHSVGLQSSFVYSIVVHKSVQNRGVHLKILLIGHVDVPVQMYGKLNKFDDFMNEGFVSLENCTPLICMTFCNIGVQMN